MRLTDYERRGLWRLPSQVFKAIERAATLHRAGSAPSNRALAAHAAAVRALSDFAGVHFVYEESVGRRMDEAGVSGACPEPEQAWGEMGDGARESLVHALDKCSATRYAIGNARRLLAKMEGA